MVFLTLAFIVVNIDRISSLDILFHTLHIHTQLLSLNSGIELYLRSVWRLSGGGQLEFVWWSQFTRKHVRRASKLHQKARGHQAGTQSLFVQPQIRKPGWQQLKWRHLNPSQAHQSTRGESGMMHHSGTARQSGAGEKGNSFYTGGGGRQRHRWNTLELALHHAGGKLDGKTRMTPDFKIKQEVGTTRTKACKEQTHSPKWS